MNVGDIRKQLEGMPDEMPVMLRMENDPPDNLSVTFHGLQQNTMPISGLPVCFMWVSIDDDEDDDAEE